MAEYLSPGVYVEEFDSGIKAMEGVGTSTAGFIGMARKGPVSGMPVLVTSIADYRRRFGGYLPERTYGEMRFLPYAVEQFFNNGGSACYVMRVCGQVNGAKADGKEKPDSGDVKKDGGGETPDSGDVKKDGSGETPDSGNVPKESAASAVGSLAVPEKEAKPFLTFTAANPGAWGNSLTAVLIPLMKCRTAVIKAEEKDGKTALTLPDTSDFLAGDLVCIQYAQKDKPAIYNRIADIQGAQISLKWKMEAIGKEDKVFLYLVEWNLSVQDETASEQYEDLSLHPERNNFMEHAMKKSQLVTAAVNTEQLGEESLKTLFDGAEDPALTVAFSGGSDGKIKFAASLYIGQDGAPDARTGLMAFKTISDVSLMAVPGITDPAVQSALVGHCEELKNRFAILDMPFLHREVADLQEFREGIDSSYAAMYHPWLQCYDPLVNRNVFLPPSGSVAGIYARTDNTRGVHKAPANEVVRNCTGLSVSYNEAEQAKLNPKGINLIRKIPGQGIRVWGARTCSSDGNWKYVNVRRLFIFIEESIRANTNWAVFEPNDEMLWSRVEGTIRVFLTTQWRNGAFAGGTADEAFFINIGKSTMTEDDILNGRLICVIGVAPVRPAEFVIFRITQKMESAQ